MEIPVWTAEEARERDAEARAAGIEEAWLMEMAGDTVARWLRHQGVRKVAVLAGPGHNGGDGLVAARRLAGREVEVALLLPLGTRHDQLLATALSAGVLVLEETDWLQWADEADWIVDAGFGTGLNRASDVRVSRPLRQAAREGHPILAVDLPSGVDADTGTFLGEVAPARVTLTFDGLKPAHLLMPACRVVGDPIVADIGLARRPGRAFRLPGPSDVAAWLPHRARDAHKYEGGRLGVVAGSERFAGALGLVLLAAFRAGSGYVEAWTHPTARDRLTFLPAVVHAVPPGPEGTITPTREALEGLGRCQSVVFGPGLGGPDPDWVSALQALGRPTVVDADGLTSWIEAGRPPWPLAVFTPHAAEAARLLETNPGWVAGHPLEAARQLAEAMGGTVLLKGPRTVVANAARPTYLNVAGGEELATAGTGDVLAGILGAMLARGGQLPETAAAAAFWHGMSAERQKQHLGHQGVTAEDVANGLGQAARDISAGRYPERWPTLWI
jgi:hydroxyethylthiazole kinase-like uncharacterized protein yjeF